MPSKNSVIAVTVLALLVAAFALPGTSFAWKVERAVVKDGKVTGYTEEQIPDDRVPMGVAEVKEAVGVFGFPDEKMGFAVTAEQANVNTNGWKAVDYIQYQTSFLGMEVKPQKDYVGDFQFDLIDKEGRMRTRKVYQFRKGYYGEGGIRYKNMVYFFEPPDLKGMSILIAKPSDETKADDQWIYLPALRKVRRISAAQKMDAFGGTDMTNDQIDRATGMWDYKLAGEFTLYVDKPPINNCFGSEPHRGYMDGRHCVMVEMTPKNKDWPVSREVCYYDKVMGTWYYEESYDKGGKLVKILLPFMNHMYPKQPIYATYGDWYAHDLRTDHKTMMYLPEIDKAGHKVMDYKTRDWSNYVFWYDVGYSDEYLSQDFMMRGTR
jgi:hypothetical protein